MRPYLAVIRDSFHEALVSRVLWILLAVVTVFLLVLAPLGIVEQAGSYLRDEDILNRDKLSAAIAAAGKASTPSPARRIWELLDESTRAGLDRKAGNDDAPRPRRFDLSHALEGLIERRDFYRPEDWKGVTLGAEARTLAAKGLDSLPEDQLARFNRLALEAAFPNEIASAPAKQTQLAYFHWKLGLTLAVEPEQLHPAINQLVVATLATLLGVAGVFVAVLVTASIIPQTFEAGSVDLLLSKPISRSWLFLAKFVGGCAFIAINAAYLIGGLWLILGVRFGLWNARLLWAIPLYLFLFAIYYSVSALAGLVWRNAIVSVVMAIVFWFVCWTLGTATSVVEALSLDPRRLVTIVPAGDTLIAVDQSDVVRWNDESGDWQRIFVGHEQQMPFMMPKRLAGPIYDAAGQRILAFKAPMPGFGPWQGRTRLLVGRRSDDWRREEGVSLPDGAFALVQTKQGDVLTVSPQGIYKLEGNWQAKQDDINVFGLHIPLPENGGRFASAGSVAQLRPLEGAALDFETGAIVLFDGHRLVLCQRDAGGNYQQPHEVTFDRKLQGKVGMGNGQVYLALADGELRRYSDKLEPLDPLSSGLHGIPSAVMVSRDGHFLAVLSRQRRLWQYDLRQSKAVSSVAGQGDISAAAMADGKLYVADRVTRVVEYELGTMAVARQWQGPMPLAETIYRYALEPLYTVFPKPSQLNQTVTYMLTSNDAPVGGLRLEDPEGRAAKVEVWGPVWSNLAFLVVVLTISCAYVSRKDF